MRADPALTDQVDARVEQILELLPQSHEVDQASTWLHLDHQVDVAARPRITAGRGPEHANVIGAVVRGALQDLTPARRAAFLTTPDSRGAITRISA